MKLIYIFVLFTLLASCSTEVNKKVLVLGRGDLQVQDNNIKMSDGAGSAEKEMDIEKSWKELAIETAAGKKNQDIPGENGYYILNLKKDTIIGSYQELGINLSSRKAMTQEELKAHIDSLIALTSGTNISYTRNFFCLPGQLLKVSANTDARIYGPYKKIPRELKPDKNGGNPEIYKFYTNAEMRDLIETFKESSIFFPHKKDKVKITGK